MNKTIGVLGGMGPYATVDFMRLLLDLTPVSKETDHFRVVVDSNPRIPSRTRAYLFSEADPVPGMIKGVKSLLAAGADFVVVPCNSAHYFLPRVFEKISTPYIDMVETTSEVLAQQGWTRVGVLAGEVTVGAGLYDKRLAAKGIDIVHVSDEEQRLVREVIEDVKNNAIGDATRSTMQKLTDILCNGGAQSIVLACTELQAVIRDMPVAVPCVDSTEALARAAIDRATELQREASGE